MSVVFVEIAGVQFGLQSVLKHCTTFPRGLDDFSSSEYGFTVLLFWALEESVISLRDATGPANILTEDEHIQVFSMSFGRGERSRTCVLWNGFLLSKRKEEAEQDLHRPLF
jgi:hypothetical protein